MIMFPNLVYNTKQSKSDEQRNVFSHQMNKASTSSQAEQFQYIPQSSSNQKTRKQSQKMSSSSPNDSLIANLNARAVLLSNLIQNSTSQFGLIPQMSNEPLIQSFNPAALTLAANEYFNNYLQSLNQTIQFDKKSGKVWCLKKGFKSTTVCTYTLNNNSRFIHSETLNIIIVNYSNQINALNKIFFIFPVSFKTF